MRPSEDDMSMQVWNTERGWLACVTVGGGDTILKVPQLTADLAFDRILKMYDGILGETDDPCPTCSGSGLGLHSDTTCLTCHGTGIERGNDELES